MAHPAAISLLLMGATLGAFWPVLHAEFINYDDPDYVTANPTIQAGLSWRGVAWAFRATHASNWHPLTWLSHMADVQLFGQSPAGPHGVNLALHAANAVLLFLLLNGMTRAPGRSALVAGLFALHPLHVESVAWVAERKDVLSTFFGFLTLLAYANYAQDRKAQDEERSAGADSEIPSRSVVWWVLALLFFICSLMSKPMLVTLPFLMLLFDYWPLGRTARQGWGQAKLAGAKAGAGRCLVAEKIPFFVLSAVSCVITATAQATAMPALVHLGLGQRIENALVAYGQYVGKAFYPKGLTLPYLHPGQWPDEKVVLGAALVVGVSSVALVLGRRLPFLITGWFCYLGTLVPVIGLVQVGIQSMADRYTYVPLAGVFIAAVWGAAEAAARWRAPRIWAWGVGGLALLICGVLTRDQAGYWHDSERLFRHAAEVTPDNYVALANVGGTLFARGRLDEAMGYYERSVRVNPYYAEAVNSIGAIMAAKGKDEASDWFRKALVLQPNHLYALFNLGNAMANKGQPAEAARYFEAALRVRPDNYEARNNLGNALVKLGRLEEAEAQYRLALNTKPDAGRIYRNLAGTLADRGNFEEAIVNFRLALKYQTTNDPALHYSLGLALAVRGRWGEAIEQYGTTLQSAPTNAEAEYNLGYALRMKGDLQQADVHLTAALRLRPDFPLAHYNLGCVLADAGRQEDAIHHLREAVKQKPDYEEAKQKLGKLTRETAN